MSSNHSKSQAVFRPNTNRRDEIDIARDVLACVLSAHITVYVAVPVTGGPRFVDWFDSSGRYLIGDAQQYASGLRRCVIDPNVYAATQYIMKQQGLGNGVLINPSQFYVPTWEQNDYRYFWSLVIEQYADRAVFLDGWNLSSGCVYEFLVCSAKRISISDHLGQPIGLDEGVALARDGLTVLQNLGADVEFYCRVIRELERLAERE